MARTKNSTHSKRRSSTNSGRPRTAPCASATRRCSGGSRTNADADRLSLRERLLADATRLLDKAELVAVSWEPTPAQLQRAVKKIERARSKMIAASWLPIAHSGKESGT